MRQLKLASLLMAGMLVVGCAGTTKKNAPTPPPPATMDEGANTSGLGGNGAGGAQEYGAGGMNGEMGAGGNADTQQLEQRVIYFAYDSSTVDPEYMDVIRNNAEYLLSHNGQHVTLEGHTDERGSREYNVGLGMRRAEAVKRILLARGVPESQIDTISYGEERPADPGHDEQAWAKNRRVEFRYGGG